MMSEVAIRVENLGKEYRIGGRRQHYRMLRDTLFEAAVKPIRVVGSRLRRLSRQSTDQRVWALKGVSFEVKRGEALGIIGHNGAGKSTLLKILSKITEPTEGMAEIHGRVGSLLEVGTGFHQELTGRENINLNGAILGMRKAEIRRRFDEIVAFAEVEKFIDTPVKHYSSGMYLRLAFAVAAHLEPEILIVDEVLAVGDAQFQKKCLGKMQDVSQGQGRTVLFVSHNMNAIQRLCSECVLLERGRLIARGDTASVVARYLAGGSGTSSPREWIDVSQTRRTGSGEARFLAVQYDSFNEQAAFHPYPDGQLQFLLAIMSDSPRSVGSISVSLNDQYGAKLVNTDTILLGQVIALQKGRNEVSLKIESLHLKPGVYVIGLWLAGGISTSTVFDYVESAFEVEVVDLETRGFGVRTHGTVTCQFEFSQRS